MSDLRDYNSSQWWFKELEGIWNADLGSAITHVMKRAAKVAINMVKEVEALHLKNTEAWREDYRKKQAAGVKFECCGSGVWIAGTYGFLGREEDYREVPQEVSASECQKALEHLAKTYSADKGTAQLNPPTPHAAERALWKAQREAGTNEVWQQDSAVIPNAWLDFPIDIEPAWRPDCKYRVKPMKLTARIVRINWWVVCAPAGYSIYKEQTWEFYGTREEYRAECEKYGYVVVSEITEVKPKTVKYYFALFKTPDGRVGAESHQDKQRLRDWLITCCYTIIGDIETREVEV